MRPGLDGFSVLSALVVFASDSLWGQRRFVGAWQPKWSPRFWRVCHFQKPAPFSAKVMAAVILVKGLTLQGLS